MGRFSEKKKRISNWPHFSVGVLLCLVLISTHFTAGIFARYTAVNSGSDAARVAAFVFKKADKAKWANISAHLEMISSEL